MGGVACIRFVISRHRGEGSESQSRQFWPVKASARAWGNRTPRSWYWDPNWRRRQLWRRLLWWHPAEAWPVFAVAHAFQLEEDEPPQAAQGKGTAVPPPSEQGAQGRSRSRSVRHGVRRQSNPRSPKRAKRTSFNFGDDGGQQQLSTSNSAREISKYGLRCFDNKAQAPDTQNADGFGQHVLSLAQVQIRCLLGKNGATIQSIMRQTGAQIVVRSPPSAYEGVVTVSGNFQPALKLIEELLASKGCPLTDRPAMGLGDAPGIIEVPDGLIGQLIGRTAFFVEVQAKLGTETVIQRLPYTSPSGKRLVQVAGDHWLEAKQMVEQWVTSFSGGRKINGYFRPSNQEMTATPFPGGNPPAFGAAPPPALTSTPANAPSNPSWRL